MWDDIAPCRSLGLNTSVRLFAVVTLLVSVGLFGLLLFTARSSSLVRESLGNGTNLSCDPTGSSDDVDVMHQLHLRLVLSILGSVYFVVWILLSILFIILGTVKKKVGWCVIWLVTNTLLYVLTSVNHVLILLTNGHLCDMPWFLQYFVIGGIILGFLYHFFNFRIVYAFIKELKLKTPSVWKLKKSQKSAQKWKEPNLKSKERPPKEQRHHHLIGPRQQGARMPGNAPTNAASAVTVSQSPSPTVSASSRSGGDGSDDEESSSDETGSDPGQDGTLNSQHGHRHRHHGHHHRHHGRHSRRHGRHHHHGHHHHHHGGHREESSSDKPASDLGQDDTLTSHHGHHHHHRSRSDPEVVHRSSRHGHSIDDDEAPKKRKSHKNHKGEKAEKASKKGEKAAEDEIGSKAEKPSKGKKSSKSAKSSKAEMASKESKAVQDEKIPKVSKTPTLGPASAVGTKPKQPIK